MAGVPSETPSSECCSALSFNSDADDHDDHAEGACSGGGKNTAAAAMAVQPPVRGAARRFSLPSFCSAAGPLADEIDGVDEGEEKRGCTALLGPTAAVAVAASVLPLPLMRTLLLSNGVGERGSRISSSSSSSSSSGVGRNAAPGAAAAGGRWGPWWQAVAEEARGEGAAASLASGCATLTSAPPSLSNNMEGSGSGSGSGGGSCDDHSPPPPPAGATLLVDRDVVLPLILRAPGETTTRCDGQRQPRGRLRRIFSLEAGDDDDDDEGDEGEGGGSGGSNQLGEGSHRSVGGFGLSGTA